jgi:glycosyltransferase involved in cell wall biosynthesis
MKIVSVNVHYQDHLGYQDYYLGKEWVKMGHEVHYVASDVHFDYPDYDNTVKHLIGDKYIGTGIFYNDFNTPVHRLKGTDKKLTGFIWLKGFKKKLLELKPDILVLHGIFNYQTIRALFFADELNCRVIMDDHTAAFFLRKSKKAEFAYWLFRTLFAKKIHRVADKLIGITPSAIDVMKEKFGLSGDKVCLVILGSDTDLFRKSDELRSKGRDYFEVEEDEILVLYTGKIYPEKKVHLIIDALNDPGVSGGKKVVIGVVGGMDAGYKALLNEKIATSACRVIIKPAVTQEVLPMLYNAADVCVWPDSLTTSTIDASACGCPIICSNNMPERTSYNNGILIEGGNLEQLKAALKKLIADPGLRKEMGDRGVKYVIEKLSWEIIARQFLD